MLRAVDVFYTTATVRLYRLMMSYSEKRITYHHLDEKIHHCNEVWVFDRLNSISDNEKFIAVDVFNFDSIYISQ